MKKQYIVFLFLLFGSSMLFAQVEKGKWLLACYSNLGIDIGKYKWESSDGGDVTEYKYTQFNLTPMAGYFVIDKLAVGLFMDYQYYKDENVDNSSDLWKNKSFTIGPFAKYYILEYKGIWPYVGGGIGFGSGKSGYEDSEHKWNILTYRVGVGATYFLTDNVGLDLSLGYNYDAQKYDNSIEKSTNASDNKDYNSGFKMGIGFIVTLGK